MFGALSHDKEKQQINIFKKPKSDSLAFCFEKNTEFIIEIVADSFERNYRHAPSFIQPLAEGLENWLVKYEKKADE